MNVMEFKIEVGGRIRGLLSWKRVAFSITVFERMIPNFALFTMDHPEFGYSVLLAALAKAYGHLEGHRYSWFDGLTSESFDAISIETEGDLSLYVSAALDAISSAALMMDILEDQNPDLAMELVNLSIDTVDMYIQKAYAQPSDSGDLENFIEGHALMLNEMGRQLSTLDVLEQIPRDQYEGWMQFLRERPVVSIGSLPRE